MPWLGHAVPALDVLCTHAPPLGDGVRRPAADQLLAGLPLQCHQPG